MTLLMKRYYGTMFLLLLFSVLLLSACAPTVVDPVPLNQLTTQVVEYQIQPGDVLDIKFYYNKELNEEVTVRPDGRIALQLAGEINTTNLTPAQLTDLLTKTYAAELNDPEITVIVRSFNSQKAYVDGEVNNPGMINLDTPTTALQAISQAGGLKKFARANEVILIRVVTDNEFNSTILNLEKALDGTDKKQDVILMPKDIIYVPKPQMTRYN